MIIIAGPTASGKNQLAMALAQHLPISIINGDAMQIYRELPILTAHPPQADRNAISHQLYGIADAAQACSVADWLAHLQQAIADSFEHDLVPVIVGGSSMYLHRLLKGLAQLPPTDAALLQQAQDILTHSGNQALHEKLADDDQTRVHANDTMRMVRCYAVYHGTGKSLGWWQQQSTQSHAFLDNIKLIKIALLPERQMLYQRCNQRFLTMIQQGALDEVKALIAKYDDDTLPLMRAIGVQPLKAYLTQEIDEKQAIGQAQQQTRNYAKRQYSWLNNHYPADAVIADGSVQPILELWRTQGQAQASQ